MVLIGTLTAAHKVFYRYSVISIKVKRLLGVNHRIDKLNTHHVKGGMLKQQLRTTGYGAIFFSRNSIQQGLQDLICTSICELPGQASAVVFNWFEDSVKPEVTPKFL